MYGSTFDFIATRAAEYPVVMRRSQMHKAIRRVVVQHETGDPGCRWLLLNILATNRFLKGTAGKRAG